MKNNLSIKKRRINSKKGVSLVELIVAIMIIMLTITAATHGLNLSYKSVLLGAAKDDAQSLAQRDCDIIMSAISKSAENGTLSSKLTGTGASTNFTTGFLAQIQNDTKLSHFDSIGYSYDSTQYLTITESNGVGAVDSDKKACYVDLTAETRDIVVAGTTTTCDVYKVTVYVYYGYKDNMYLSCEGEVTIEP